MNGLTALETKTKAGAPCDMSSISKRGRALVKAGASRVVRPHKGPALQKPAKLKSAYRLRSGQVEKPEQQRCELKRRSTDAIYANKGRLCAFGRKTTKLGQQK